MDFTVILALPRKPLRKGKIHFRIYAEWELSNGGKSIPQTFVEVFRGPWTQVLKELETKTTFSHEEELHALKVLHYLKRRAKKARAA